MTFTRFRPAACAAALALALVAAPLIPAQAAGTLDRIAETGVFTIGYRTGEPPMSFADPDGQPAGYSVDLCRVVAEEARLDLGLESLDIRYLAVTAEDRFDKIASGEIDILCGVTTRTLTRAATVGFSQLTFATGGALLSMDDGDRIERLSDLAGRKVAVGAGTSTLEILAGKLQAGGVAAEIVQMDSADASIAALLAGEVDAYAADQVVLVGKVLSQTDASLSYFIAGDLFSFEPLALAHAHGDVAFQLVADRALSRLYRSGAVLKIYENWFGAFGQAPTAAQRALWQLGSTPE